MRNLMVLLVLGICSVVFAAEMDSWGEGLKSWEALPDAKIDVVELQIDNGGAGKQPTSKRAMRITVPDGAWRPAANTTKPTEAVTEHTTMEIDLLVPPDSLPTGKGAFAGLDITIRGQPSKGNARAFRVQKRLKLDPTAKDWRQYHFTWKYADEEGFPKGSTPAQVTINTQSSGSTPWSVYVTGIKLGK